MSEFRASAYAFYGYVHDLLSRASAPSASRSFDDRIPVFDVSPDGVPVPLVAVRSSVDADLQARLDACGDAALARGLAADVAFLGSGPWTDRDLVEAFFLAPDPLGYVAPPRIDAALERVLMAALEQARVLGARAGLVPDPDELNVHIGVHGLGEEPVAALVHHRWERVADDLLDLRRWHGWVVCADYRERDGVPVVVVFEYDERAAVDEERYRVPVPPVDLLGAWDAVTDADLPMVLEAFGALVSDGMGPAEAVTAARLL